jgi:hypothetical protein
MSRSPGVQSQGGASPELNPDELGNADLKHSLPKQHRSRNQAEIVGETRPFCWHMGLRLRVRVPLWKPSRPGRCWTVYGETPFCASQEAHMCRMECGG